LHRAIVAVAEFELEDDPRAAVALLGELDDPPAALLARARMAAAAAASRHSELEKLDRLHDAAIGTRTRFFITMVLGVIFTVTPMIVAMNPAMMPTSHRDLVLWSVGLLGLMLAFGVWARESLRKTLINRRVFAAGVFLFVSQGVLMLAARAMGLTILQAEQLMMFLWFALAGMAAIGIDRRLSPMAVGYGVAFCLVVAYPDWLHYLMSASNFVFLVNTTWQWRPATFRPTSEELERYRRD
jgi:hypothetical protein